MPSNLLLTLQTHKVHLYLFLWCLLFCFWSTGISVLGRVTDVLKICALNLINVSLTQGCLFCALGKLLQNSFSPLLSNVPQMEIVCGLGRWLHCPISRFSTCKWQWMLGVYLGAALYIPSISNHLGKIRQTQKFMTFLKFTLVLPFFFFWCCIESTLWLKLAHYYRERFLGCCM